MTVTDPQLVKVEDDGSEYIAAEIADREVRIRTALLRQFQAARQLDLLLFIDSVRYVDHFADSVDLDSLREEAAGDLDRFVFAAADDDSNNRVFSRYLAKKVARRHRDERPASGHSMSAWRRFSSS